MISRAGFQLTAAIKNSDLSQSAVLTNMRTSQVMSGVQQETKQALEKIQQVYWKRKHKKHKIMQKQNNHTVSWSHAH